MIAKHHLASGVALTAGACLMAGAAAAQPAWPNQTIRIIVGFGAGDAIDGTARLIADRMSDELDTPTAVINIPGGGGARGLAQAATADADGHVMVMGSTGALTARPLYSDAGYTPDSFAAIAQLTEVPIGLAVASDSEFDDIGDIIEAAEANPGDISYASPAPGSTQHINMEAFAQEQGIELSHVSGQGGQGAVQKALTGEVDFVFVGASNYVSLAESGDLDVLGVAAEERVDYLPEAPTFQEAGYDMVAAVWFGLLVPEGVPEDVLSELRTTTYEIAQSDETLDAYNRFNLNPAFLRAEAFRDRIEANVERHRGVLQTIGLLE